MTLKNLLTWQRIYWLALICACQSVIAAPISHYQVIGSHNSYKKALAPQVLAWLQQQQPQLATQLNYAHPSLQQQLNSGLRQLEIDVVADPMGGHYLQPWAEEALQATMLTAEDKAILAQPGFKTLHVPGLDMGSHCLLFRTCLAQLRDWSLGHPQHFPLMILLNAKENQPGFVASAAPVAFTAESYAELDKVIDEELGASLFRPDDLRASAASLRSAVLRQGWPELEDMRGKILFVFDANTAQAELYRHQHPSLAGRAMFASYPATEAEAAILVMNDPEAQQQQIQHFVAQGFMVRTRADADFTASAAQRLAQFSAAKTSGAHWISSDFYPGSPQQIHTQSGSTDVSFHPAERLDTTLLVRPNPLFNQ